MRKQTTRFLIFFLVLSVVASGALAAERKKTQKENIQRLLEKFPAPSSSDRDQLASKILQLGTEGILVVCRMLVPPGGGDDSRARFAVSAMTTYVNQKGMERARERYARTLVKAVDLSSHSEIKNFLIRQLQRAGKEESIKPLRKYLDDQRLCEPAAQALLAIGTEKAEKALLQSLGKAEEGNQVTIIQALGQMQSRKAALKILKYAYSRNQDLRQAALFALANIGDPSTERVLDEISVLSPSYERARAPVLFLLYARRLAEQGHRSECVRICRRMIKNYTAPQESHIPCQALSLLVEMGGRKALEDVLHAVESSSPDLRWRALTLAENFPAQEATRKWLRKMDDVPPDVQAEIITMLGKRGDKTALPMLLEKLGSEEKTLRLAAVPAAAKLGGSDVLSGLMPLLRTGEEEDVQAVQRALLGFPAPVVIPEVIKALPNVPPLSKGALLEILSERHAREQGEVVFTQVKSQNDNVKQAALAALENVVSEKDLSRLIRMLLSGDNAKERRWIQNAIVASAHQILDPERRALLLIENLSTAEGEKRAWLLKPLSRIGGQKALHTVIEEINGEDPKVQTMAVSVLADWPEMGAAPELLRICRNTKDQKHLLMAITGYVRLVVESDRDAASKISQLKQALDAAADPMANRVVLAGVGEVQTIESFRMAVSFLGEPDVCRQAAQTVARIALSAPPLDLKETLPKEEFLPGLIKSARLVEDDNLRKRMDPLIGELLMEEGFVPLFNRKDLTGWKGLVGNPVSRAKMRPEELEKAQQEADQVMRAHWKVKNGVLVFDGKGKNLCTVKDYADFDLLVDWKIEEGGDSGIYLRGFPQVQIWDSAQRPKGSGGLYNNTLGPSQPLQKADNPTGQWNTFRIKMVGERVWVYLNDILVVDNVVMENYWEQDKPIYRTGQIELQAHNTPLYFRNIYIREIFQDEGP